jgi:hypothetical protein
MFSGFLQISPTDLRKIEDTQNGITLGTIGVTRDGLFFAWSKAGSANIATGILTVNADLSTDHNNNTIAATASAGALSVTIDADGATTQDAYKDGRLTINDETGEGHNYLIAGNTATTGAGEVIVYLQEPLIEGVTVDVSEGTLKKNTYDGAVISATDQLDQPIGVPTTAVTATYYFWNQIRGEASVLADASTHARGSEMTISAATAGAVGLKDAAGEPKVGVYSETIVSTEYRSSFLTML